MKSVSEDNLVVEIVDPSRTVSNSSVDEELKVETVTKKESSCDQNVGTVTNTVEKKMYSDSVSNREDSQDKPFRTASPIQNGHEDTKQYPVPLDKSEASSLDLPVENTENGLNDLPKDISSDANVQVEKDGSVFVKADDEYLKRRYEASKSKDEESTQQSETPTADTTRFTKSGIQLSNQLIYSLD